MRRKNATLKTNVGCTAQCLPLCLRVLNEGFSIPGHDSRRALDGVLLATGRAISDLTLPVGAGCIRHVEDRRNRFMAVSQPWERGALKFLREGEVRTIKVYLLGSLFIAGGISVAFGWEAVSRWWSRDLGPFTASYVETHEECLNRLVAEGAGDLRDCPRSTAGVH
jgi:hypothetical protein